MDLGKSNDLVVRMRMELQKLRDDPDRDINNCMVLTQAEWNSSH